MSETFRQYIKIRTFLGYRPKEILLELQNAFGDEAPTYANVQRWSKRFRNAVDSPLGSVLNFDSQENQMNGTLDDNDDDNENSNHRQINANARKSQSKRVANKKHKSKRFINE